MSHRTVMNRWRRYQKARLEGLIEGLMRETKRVPGADREGEVKELGAAMVVALEAYCDEIATRVDRGIQLGAPCTMPDLAFERL